MDRPTATRGLLGLYRCFEYWSEKLVSYPLDLAARWMLGLVFFKAGYARINDWDSQSFMFGEIHPVPGLPPEIAAVVTTAGELVLPILLWLGLFGRAAALGLLAMTVVIQFVVGQTPQGIENKIANPDHYWWMLVAGYLWVRGPGPISLDRWLLRRGAAAA